MNKAQLLFVVGLLILTSSTVYAVEEYQQHLVEAISWIYPSTEVGVDYTLRDDGAGAYIFSWSYSEPQPTNENLNIAWQEYKPTIEYNYTTLLATEPPENLYRKAIVPNRNDFEWNLSMEFAETKQVLFLGKNIRELNDKRLVTSGEYRAWVCCNITRGDRLYTADATSNTALRGTLTNLYNINYKSRFPRDDDSFRNIFVGASTKPDVYNRRAALHIDGTQVAWARETKNVSISGIPELMKVTII